MTSVFVSKKGRHSFFTEASHVLKVQKRCSQHPVYIFFPSTYLNISRTFERYFGV